MKTLSAESIYNCIKSDVEIMSASKEKVFTSIFPIDGIDCYLVFAVKDGEIIIIELSDYINEVPIITDEEELKIAIINHFKK
jgi:hypothetical protein